VAHPDLVADDMKLPLVTHEVTASGTGSLPDLNYSLRERRVEISTFWSLVFFDSLMLPVLLYFAL
jgi:hypothetical protein